MRHTLFERMEVPLAASILLILVLRCSALAYTVSKCKVEVEKVSFMNETSGAIWIPRGRSGLYLNNQHCRWLITAPFPNQTITVHIDEYEIELHESCDYDFVIVYDGTDECSEPLSKPICGSGRNISFTSKGSQIMIVFSSDYSTDGMAFNIDFTINDVPNIKSIRISGKHHNHQKSKTYNYQGNIFARGRNSCNRTITTNFSERVFIHILDFRRSLCSHQVVLVYERFGTIWHYADRLCRMDSFQSNAPAVMIKIQSHDKKSKLSLLKIHFYVVAQNISSGRPITHRDGNALLSIPNGVPYMVTDTYKIHAWHMIAPLGNIVSLKWTLLNYGNESGFILIKEGPTAAAPTVYREISHRNDMQDEFAQLVWIQDDLDILGTENLKQLAAYGTFRANHFEVLLILGVKTSHKFRFWANYETVPLITNPELASICFYRSIGMIYEQKCYAFAGPHFLKPDETAEITLNRQTDNHYTKWTFLMDDGKFAKVSFFNNGSYSMMRNCMYTGLGFQEIFENGSAGHIMGPFCSRPYGEVIIPYRHFSIIVYRNRLFKSSEIFTKIVVSVSYCRSLFISNISLNPYTDISKFECIRIQEIIPASRNDISSIVVSSKNMNTYLSATKVFSSECEKSPPAVSKQNSNNVINFSIQYNHSCHENAFPSYIAFKISPKTDCDLIKDIDHMTINLENNSFCGFVRLTQFPTSSEHVVFSWSYNKACVGRHYYNLFFYFLIVPRGTLIIEEKVSPSLEPYGNNSLLSDAGVVQKYEEFTNLNMTDFELNSIRTEMIRLTFAGYMNKPYSIIMDYQLRTYNSLSDHRQLLCSSGFVQYEDNCYMFVNMITQNPRTWHQGESECSKHNATLLSITSKMEMDAMKQLLAEKWTHFIFSKKIFMIYIGLQDKEKVNIELMYILECCNTYLKQTNQSIFPHELTICFPEMFELIKTALLTCTTHSHHWIWSVKVKSQPGNR